MSFFLPNFAALKQIRKDMKEKKYPVIEEEEGKDVACEPVATAAVPLTDVDDPINDNEQDELDWSHFPSQGPFSEEEAVARIDEFEEQLRNGQVEWIPSEQAWEHLYNKFPWLR